MTGEVSGGVPARTALVTTERIREGVGAAPFGARLALWDEFVAGEVAPESVGLAVLTVGHLQYREHLRSLPNLTAVRIGTIGYDWLTPYLPAGAGVRIFTSADVLAGTTAETAVLGLIAMLRSLPEHIEAAREHRWIPHTRRGPHEHGITGVMGATVLVVGQGPVGRGIADRLEAFQAHVARFARTARRGPNGERVHAIADLDEWLPRADAVELALPITDETDGLVDEAFLARMKPGAVIGNIGRGRVVDTSALIRAARSGRVRAALDVVDPEPLPPDHALWSTPNVLITPHVGGSSRYVRENIEPSVAATVGRFLRSEPLGEPATIV